MESSSSAGAQGVSSLAALTAAADTKLRSSHTTKLVLRNKVLVVGDAAVGKSTLIASFASGGSDVPKHYLMTTSTDFKVKSVSLKHDEDNKGGATNHKDTQNDDDDEDMIQLLNSEDPTVVVNMYLLDMAGSTIFNQREFGTQHWHSFGDIVLVYDVSNRESFKSCAKWYRRIQDTQPGRPLTGIVIANKCDLSEDGRRVVSEEEGKAYAAASRLQYFETSSLTGAGVDRALEQLGYRHYQRYKKHLEDVSEV